MPHTVQLIFFEEPRDARRLTAVTHVVGDRGSVVVMRAPQRLVVTVLADDEDMAEAYAAADVVSRRVAAALEGEMPGEIRLISPAEQARRGLLSPQVRARLDAWPGPPA